MRNWRNIFSYKTELPFELGSYADLYWKSAEGEAYLMASYYDIAEKLGEGIEETWGCEPEIAWVLKWPDGIVTLISGNAKNYGLEDEDDEYEAIRESGKRWTVFVGEKDHEKTDEIIERLVKIFGRDIVK
jgi:hypothetical protein